MSIRHFALLLLKASKANATRNPTLAARQRQTALRLLIGDTP